MGNQLRIKAVKKRVEQMYAALKGGKPLTTEEIMELGDEYREYYILGMQEQQKEVSVAIS